MASLDLTKRLKISTDLIKSLQSDLKKMTAIYKSIPENSLGDPDGRLFKEAEKLFQQFASNLKEVVTKQILDHDVMSKDDERDRQLRKKVSSLSFSLTRGGINKGTEMFPRTSPSQGAPPHYFQLDKVRDTNIRRYQGEARAFFDALTDWVASKSQEGVAPEREAMLERTTLAGVSVVINKTGSGDWIKEWDSSPEEALRYYLPTLEHSFGRIRKMGFGVALNGLEVHINFRPSSQKVENFGHAAGTYDHTRDVVNMYPNGFVTEVGDQDYTITHEIGHRFWYRNVSTNGRAAWTDAFHNKAMTTVTKESADLWSNALSSRDFWKESEKRALAQRLTEGADRATVAHINHLLEDGPDTRVGENPNDFRQRLNYLVGEEVPLEKISTYGETKPEEAFAEAFRIYITKGPAKLGPATRQLFKEVCETSGSRISGRAEVIKALRAAADALEGSSPPALSSRRRGR